MSAVAALRNAPRRTARLTVVLLGFVFLGLALAAPASAHATLLFADPAIEAASPASPPTLTLVFDETVGIDDAPIRLRDATGHLARLGPARTTNRGRVVVVPVTDRLADGVYRVHWQAVSDDGDTIAGDYRFAIGDTTGAALLGSGGRSSAGTPGLPTTTTLRWLLFVALAGGLGAPVGVRLTRSRAPAGVRAFSPGASLPAALGVLATLGLALVAVGRGSVWRGATDPAMRTLVEGRAGPAALTELVAFVVAGCLVFIRRPRWAPVPLVAVLVAEGVRAHPETAVPGWGALLTVVHLLAASVWVGALVVVVGNAVRWHRHGGDRQARALIGAYARLAGFLFTAVVATGTISALLLVPWSGWTSTGYGRTLLVKLALVAAVAALALVARRGLHLHSRPDAPPPAGRAIRLEAAALALVLPVTGLLVSLPTPRTLGDTDLPFPPPAIGLVMPVGARAGQIGVSAAASTGQLVVHLTAPQLRNTAVNATDTNRYRLDGSLRSGSSPTVALDWRGCGAGCFVAAVLWAPGVTELSLRARSDQWSGDTVRLGVPWPPQPGESELRAVVSAMRAVDSLVLDESTTSDPRGNTGIAVRLRRSGADFMDSEPYGSGQASQAVVIGRTADGQVTLRLGFPAELIQVEVVVDAGHRILREMLTAPNHLITRTFDYPRGRKN